MNASSFFASQVYAAAGQPVSPVKMEDNDETYFHNDYYANAAQLVSPVKMEDLNMEERDNDGNMDELHSPWVNVPIKVEEDAYPLSYQDAETQRTNKLLQEQLHAARREIERLQTAQRQDKNEIRQLANDLSYEQNQREQHIQEALQDERDHQQGIVNDLLFAAHEGGGFFPQHLVQDNDGGVVNFLIMEELGQGSFGRVVRSVRVEEQGKHVPCAIKIVSVDDPAIRNEAAILKNLNHENVIKCYDTLLDEPRRELGMVMELGVTDLKELDEDMGVPDSDLREVSVGVLNALRYIHSQGISHMDIKPDNIMVMCEYGCPLRACDVKLCDFGLAVQSSIGTDYRGTRDYMAPEMIECESYNTKLADMWSLGATLMELLLGFNDQWTESYDQIRHNEERFLTGLEYCIYSLTDYYESLMTPTQRPCLELIKQLLRMDPQERLSAMEALAHNSYWLGQH